MTMRRIFVCWMVAALVAPALAMAAVPGTDEYAQVAHGTAAGNATYVLSSRRATLAGARGVCLRLELEAKPDWASSDRQCLRGSLRRKGGIASRSHRVSLGRDLVANVLYGVATTTARTIVVTFTSGVTARARAVRAPPALRHALGERDLRFFVVDGLRRTHSRPRSVVALDARGRHVARAMF